MVLLPLVENAMKHGPLARNKGKIGFVVRCSSEGVLVEISNPGSYNGPREGGSGLPIVQKRLDLAYGPGAKFSIAGDGPRTKVTLLLPNVALASPH
jgi:LytS/YehU family sensor histidine kinase